jgi:hypothetical protein
MAERTALTLLVAGAMAVATIACGEPAGAQIVTTTTIPLPTTAPPLTTTTTTTTESTTTTSSTTTTIAPGGPSAGGLSISVPTASELSVGTPVNAGAVTAQLGPVTVTDARTGLLAGWTATVSATDFTTGSGSAAETIGRTNVSYWSGPATATSGAAVFVPGQPTAEAANPLGVPRVAFSAVAGSGTSATWVPTLVVTLPLTSVVGQYHGTITHSVA